ncbi:major facilitator superfamily domain-containing protein [Astrocystis sublimbata]|nr:major facilitator superfamily domain-containing protein [Astrocystis sublimbata]
MAFILQRRALAKQVQYQLKQVKETPSSTDAYLQIPGITRGIDCDGEWYYDVGWVDERDGLNPKRWSTATRLGSTFLVCVVAFFVTVASSIDSVVIGRAAAEFGVSDVVESLATGLFLIGFGIGSLLASPLSEFMGRQPVYIVSLVIFEGWTVGAALSPNITAQLIFRFLMGLSASAPLTVAGGSISDMWSPLERTFAFPFYAIPGFCGAVFGPIVGTWIGNGPSTTWRWVEWFTLILVGFCIALLFVFCHETFAPRILELKAAAFRKYTGNAQFKTSKEASDANDIWPILKRNFGRPFILCFEPIVISFTIYLTINYIILFTFLDGYPYIFAGTYGISENLSNTAFSGLLVGILISVVLVPWTYRNTVKQLKEDGDDGSGIMLNREDRLRFAMIGAPFIPIGLFWMAWTDFSFISIWSPIVASVLIGFGMVCVYMSAYMYIIDCYEMFAASALTFNALIRYIAAGGFTVVGIPLYSNLGTHYTLTLLGVISVLAIPIPFVLYRWGPNIRARSKIAKTG